MFAFMLKNDFFFQLRVPSPRIYMYMPCLGAPFTTSKNLIPPHIFLLSSKI